MKIASLPPQQPGLPSGGVPIPSSQVVGGSNVAMNPAPASMPTPTHANAPTSFDVQLAQLRNAGWGTSQVGTAIQAAPLQVDGAASSFIYGQPAATQWLEQMQAELTYDRARGSSTVSVHAMFSGKKGTGKATWAERYAHLLKEFDRIKENKLCVIDIPELVLDSAGVNPDPKNKPP